MRKIFEMSSGTIFSLILALVTLLISFAVAKNKKGSDAIKKKPDNLKKLYTNIPPKDVFKLILGFANQQGKYEIAHFDKEKHQIVIGTPTSFKDNGAFYPIYISNSNDGKTLIEIGIKNKDIWWRSASWGALAREHETFYNGINALILSNEQTLVK